MAKRTKTENSLAGWSEVIRDSSITALKDREVRAKEVEDFWTGLQILPPLEQVRALYSKYTEAGLEHRDFVRLLGKTLDSSKEEK